MQFASLAAIFRHRGMSVAIIAGRRRAVTVVPHAAGVEMRERPELYAESSDNLFMPIEAAPPPPSRPKPSRMRVTREDLARFGDEDQAREALDEDRLRDEQPPHHR